jgi:hypothetical protein
VRPEFNAATPTTDTAANRDYIKEEHTQRKFATLYAT